MVKVLTIFFANFLANLFDKFLTNFLTNFLMNFFDEFFWRFFWRNFLMNFLTNFSDQFFDKYFDKFLHSSVNKSGVCFFKLLWPFQKILALFNNEKYKISEWVVFQLWKLFHPADWKLLKKISPWAKNLFHRPAGGKG